MKEIVTREELLALLENFPKKKTIQLGVDVKGLEGNPQGFVTVYEPSIEDWRDDALPKLEAFLEDHVSRAQLKKLIEDYEKRRKDLVKRLEFERTHKKVIPCDELVLQAGIGLIDEVLERLEMLGK